MKPRKKWEPEYRVGGNKSSHYMPSPLGTTNPHAPTKKPRKKK